MRFIESVREKSPPQSDEFAAVFRGIERKARFSGRPDIVAALDRISEMRGQERLDEATQALFAVLNLINEGVAPDTRK